MSDTSYINSINKDIDGYKDLTMYYELKLSIPIRDIVKILIKHGYSIDRDAKAYTTYDDQLIHFKWKYETNQPERKV